MNRTRLANIFVIVFVNMLGFGLILPLLPYYAQTFGANPTLIGLLVASYAAASLIGAPALGRLSDRYGRRPILLLSILGTLVGFVLLAVAEPAAKGIAALVTGGGEAGDASTLVNSLTLGLLFASRILDGLTGGNITVAQAYITDVTDEKGRTSGLGLIGAAFGLGFIIGPAVGGALSAWGYAAPAWAAAGVTFLNLLAVQVFLPESLSQARRDELARRPRPAVTLQALRMALNRPHVGPLLQTRFYFSLAFATFQTVFALFAQYRLGLAATETGFVLAYVGLLSALVQGVVVGQLARRYSERSLIFSGVILMTVSLAAWALVPNLVLLLIVLIPLALAGGTLNTVISSALTKVVTPEEVGGTLGLSAAAESLTRVIAPSLGGILLQSLGPWAPGMFAAALMAWLTQFVWRRLR
jgi:MFS transporter, DHA1 family, tetracycline resistance protein